VATGFAKLIILDKAEAKVLETIDLLDRFGAEQARFGFAECVLVDGQNVICTPGGPDASLVALDRNTGETVWKTEGLSQPSGYCSARLIQHNGKKLIVTMLEKVVVGIDPKNGKVLWQYDFPNRFGVLPNPPLYKDDELYVVGGGGKGGTLLTLADDARSVTEKWNNRELDCQMQGTVLVDGCVYGTAQNGERLVCLDWDTGETHWDARSVGQASVVAADGMLYVYGQDGTMYLVKPSSEAFMPVSQFTVSEGTAEHWAHPTIANGRLYIRHGDALMAYDIKSGS
jgi:outer membrane protein assembly factor BamB